MNDKEQLFLHIKALEAHLKVRGTLPVNVIVLPVVFEGQVLAVIELASTDLGTMVRQYLPAGHLLTIQDWRRAQQITKWYNTASNVYWAVSAVFAPYQTAIRYFASRIGLSAAPTWRRCARTA